MFLQHEIPFNINKTGPTSTYYYGLNEPRDMLFLSAYLSEKNTFIDVGANIGLYTLLANINGCKKVYSFEPDQINHSQLEINIKNWGLKNVTVIKKAIGETKQTAILAGSDVGAHLAECHESSDNQNVQVDRLDSILKQQNLTNLVLKIDVEGHELEVLKGAEYLFSQNAIDVVLVELNSNSIKHGVSHDEILEFLRLHKFRPFEFDLKVEKLLPINHKSKTSDNTIFIRDGCNSITIDSSKTTYKKALAQRKYVLQNIIYS